MPFDIAQPVFAAFGVDLVEVDMRMSCPRMHVFVLRKLLRIEPAVLVHVDGIFPGLAEHRRVRADHYHLLLRDVFQIVAQPCIDLVRKTVPRRRPS